MLCIQYLSTIGLNIRLIYRIIFRINAVFFLKYAYGEFFAATFGFHFKQAKNATFILRSGYNISRCVILIYFLQFIFFKIINNREPWPCHAHSFACLLHGTRHVKMI